VGLGFDVGEGGLDVVPEYLVVLCANTGEYFRAFGEVIENVLEKVVSDIVGGEGKKEVSLRERRVLSRLQQRRKSLRCSESAEYTGKKGEALTYQEQFP
jgi:hypothetical protein